MDVADGDDEDTLPLTLLGSQIESTETDAAASVPADAEPPAVASGSGREEPPPKKQKVEVPATEAEALANAVVVEVSRPNLSEVLNKEKATRGEVTTTLVVSACFPLKLLSGQPLKLFGFHMSSCLC